MSDRDETVTGLLRRRIRESGLSARQFATAIMGRDERTIRRWLAGEPMPEQASEWLESVEAVTLRPRSIAVRLRR